MRTILVDCEDREYRKRLINGLSISNLRYEETYYRIPEDENDHYHSALLVYYEKEREWKLDRILMEGIQ
jgi:hypothetical protein